MKKFIFLSICILFLSNAKATDITSAISSSTTWTSANSPYIIKNNIEVSTNVTLTIETGVVVKFNAGTYLHVRGTLNATGATFTANAGVTKGFWDGIYVSHENFEAGSVSLTNCTVELASNLYVRKGQMTLSNCLINNLSGTIRLSNLGTLNIDNTTISNTNFPVTYYGDGILNIESNVIFKDNTYNYIDLDFSEITQLFQLKDFGLPYYNDNSLQVRAAGTLKIDPGVNLQLASTEIHIYGKINAIGTEDKPIVFDKTATSTYWRGINIRNSSIDSACILRKCVIRNANYNYELYCALEIENASPTIDSCKFEGNAYNLNIDGNSKPMISNCLLGKSVIAGSDVYNVIMDLNASPIFVNNVIDFNSTEIRAVGLSSETVTNHNQLKKINFNGINNISYALYGNTTIHDTASLTIDPGIVIKCMNYNSTITANGVLTGIGTVTEPIIFTHIADDTSGNPSDSQNNGTQTIGQSAGGRIMLYSQAESKLENWKFNYAGYNSNNWAIYIDNNNIVNKCEIKNSSNGIWFTKNAQLTNNNFVNVNQFPVGYNLTTGTPNIQGNTIGNGYLGIQLDGVENVSPTLKKLDFAGYTNIPYILSHNITIASGNVLTINPGVIIKSTYYGIGFTVNGAIKAIGTKNEKIIFTSSKDDSAGGDTNNDGTSSIAANDWGGLKFNDSASDTDNILRNVEVRYTYGDYNTNTAVSITDCKVLMDSVKINFTNQSAIGIWGNANPEIKDCELFNIGWEPLYMDMFANPIFSGSNKLANCSSIGIKLRTGIVNGIVPKRSFAGYNPITYVWTDNPLTVTEQLTIPAGLTFKGQGRWNIKGKLNIEGTAQDPVVFTTLEDDTYGFPKDTQSNGISSPQSNGNYFVFYDAADDLSSIDHAIFRYSYQTPIQLNNASPLIKNSRFENFSREGISLIGTSTPAIEDNVFNNIKYPFNTSMLSYPRSTSGNVISGSTGRYIRINDETLTQDATLIKRDFAGIQNIPYAFKNYTVGTAAKLTIAPGIIAKFEDYGYLNVQNGLIAEGGNTTDSTIVFTSIRDDFYGGDTYNDGTANPPWNYSWQGIYFYNESIDENCRIKNCIIKYASYPDSRGAVTIDNASPSITKSRFQSGYHGIMSLNTSLPVISDCDFIDTENIGYALWNKTASNTITATNCWFNAVTGPRHASNPTGTGAKVSDYVVFTPFQTQVGKAELGDVSLNGSINPYDASLILQHNVSNITLNQAQQNVADVSKNGSISSYDASLILQYNVGLIFGFGPSINLAPRKIQSVSSGSNVSFENLLPNTETDEFTVPIAINTVQGVKSLDMKLAFNSSHIQLLDISKSNINQDIILSQSQNTENGNLFISLTSAYDLSLHNGMIYLKYKLLNTAIESSECIINSAIINEEPLSIENSTLVIPSKIVSGMKTSYTDHQLKTWVSDQTLILQFDNEMQYKDLNIKIVDISSRILVNRKYTESANVKQQIQIPLSELGNLQKGVYLIELTMDGVSYSNKLVINK